MKKRVVKFWTGQNLGDHLLKNEKKSKKPILLLIVNVIVATYAKWKKSISILYKLWYIFLRHVKSKKKTKKIYYDYN